MQYMIYTQLKGEAILKLFVESGLHSVGNIRANWESHAVCVCLVTFVDGQKTLHIAENRPRCHAEWDIIQFLTFHIQKIRSVKIYCNYSPCSEPGYTCCNWIREIKEDLKYQARRRDDLEGGSLTFVFSQLYRIARPSCCIKNCNHMAHCDGTSLSNLCRLGPSIRSFEMADWVMLIELLALSDAYCCVETGMLTSFRFGEKYGFWRDLEDAELKRDFQILKGSYNGL